VPAQVHVCLCQNGHRAQHSIGGAGQGLAALRNFNSAYVADGSPLAVWALMSAFADSGRATGSAWVRVVP
jgi:hypothetical protein